MYCSTYSGFGGKEYIDVSFLNALCVTSFLMLDEVGPWESGHI